MSPSLVEACEVVATFELDPVDQAALERLRVLDDEVEAAELDQTGELTRFIVSADAWGAGAVSRGSAESAQHRVKVMCVNSGVDWTEDVAPGQAAPLSEATSPPAEPATSTTTTQPPTAPPDDEQGPEADPTPSDCPTEPVNHLSPEATAQCLYSAWIAGDRPLAEAFAGTSAGADYQFEGCTQWPEDPPSVMRCSFYMDAEVHGGSIEMAVQSTVSAGVHVFEVMFIG